MASKSRQKALASRRRDAAEKQKRDRATAVILAQKDELAQLAHDLDTATPMQSPTWADPMTPDEYRAVCRAAETAASAHQATRQAMRSPD